MSKQVKKLEHQETRKQELKKRSTYIITLAVVLAVALIVLIFMVVSRANLASQNASLNDQLAESQAAWQAVSEEKEALQGELTTTSNALREAEVALAESTEKVTQLDGQVTELNGQVAQLTASLGDAVEANDALNAFIATTTRKALERQFAPEFLNRLDDIIMFHALDRPAAARIVRIEMDALLSRLRESGTQVLVDDAVYDHIAQTGYEPRYGARSLKRTIQEQIETPLCAALMDAAEDKPTLKVTVEDNKIKIQ